MSEPGLPKVEWKGRELSRVLVGHNPVKGGSHFSDALSQEMREWHEDQENGLSLLCRCEEEGINTAQFGGQIMHDLLREHKKRGGSLQWIATMYCNEQGDLGFGDQVGVTRELDELIKMDPRPIGIQHFGESTDRLFFEKKLHLAEDRLKRLRDAGVLVGLCTHLPEVVEEVASRGWDLDFFQTSFYTSYIRSLDQDVNRNEEIFEDADRDRMVRAIQAVDKPCLAFKVLGANRKCNTQAQVEEALRFAFDHIKPTDVVCLGMWQKSMDQVGLDTAMARRILGD